MPRPVNSRPDRVPEHLKWERVKIEPGKTLRGWIAGKVYGCEGHYAPAFKPCHAVVSGGTRSCPWCGIPQFAALRFQGYLPIYDERLKKTVLCINLDNTVRCDGFTHLQPLAVGKGKNQTSPLVVNANEWTTIVPSGAHVRKVPQDITPWLFCVLWKQELLQEYGEVEAKPLEVEPPQSTGMVPHPERAIQAAKKRGKLPSLSAHFTRGIGAGSDEMVPPPSSNGHHKSNG